MPRSGPGVYSKPAGTTAVPNQTIESSKYNSTIDDLVQDANTARPVTAGGTGATSVAAATTALKAVSYGSAQSLTSGEKTQALDNIGAVATSLSSFGQCHLALDGSSLKLSRKNGRLITVNGLHYEIPSAGVTLSASGLTPSTLYYIYAYMNSTTMTLEASTTAYTTDTATGMVIKSGDATRTLVGMARPVTGPAWANSASQRFVRSWFNEQGVTLFTSLTSNPTTASTTYVELNTVLRSEFLVWSGETVDAMVGGSAQNSTAGGGNRTSLAFNSTTTPELSGSQLLASGVDEAASFGFSAVRSDLTEGYNYATVIVSVNSGTGTWYGANDGRRTSIRTRVTK